MDLEQITELDGEEELVKKEEKPEVTWNYDSIEWQDNFEITRASKEKFRELVNRGYKLLEEFPQAVRSVYRDIFNYLFDETEHLSSNIKSYRITDHREWVRKHKKYNFILGISCDTIPDPENPRINPKIPKRAIISIGKSNEENEIAKFKQDLLNFMAKTCEKFVYRLQ
ncbi:hypothetical protein HYW74_03260 [Candidatus Pacearchaeota archaeon]|nr:hypothetical protein [Candidatus Pacearchaeota archaeon]